METASGEVAKDLGPLSGPSARRPPAPRPAAGILDIGWIQYAAWQAAPNQTITRFTGQWIVPDAPSLDGGQSIFFFIGLQQSEAGPYVLQPVLQWGASEIGGGRLWSVSNWYVNGQGSVAVQGAPPVQVQPGETLRAEIVLTGSDAEGFDYAARFIGYPAADAVVTHVEKMSWACATLEAYGANADTPLDGCRSYPASGRTSFTGIELEVTTGGAPPAPPALAWTATTLFDTCGAGCRVLADGAKGAAILMSYG